MAENPWGIPFRTGADVRQSFIDFFQGKDHSFVRSSPVVVHDDPTLMFTNAGMNQFKAIFLGDNSKGLKRVVNSQKCLRVSGKHNDLDDVGRDTTHQTLFEMLGNWSFGDYYKKESLEWGWELLTQVWKLPPERLFASVHTDDDEAYEIWKNILGPSEEWRISRHGDKDNFWEMGDVGPCGPCSEIHFDLGDPATQKETCNDPVHGINGENFRYIEIWNHVFIQNERLPDGKTKPLKDKHVDTGMGFERITSIIQGSGSNYETDVLRPLLDKIAQMSGTAYDAGDAGMPHRVVADHLRCLSFAIADGATPGNEGRGYVLRRVLRRASRYSKQLGQEKPFIHLLVPTLADIMGDAFPELRERQDYIAQAIEAEEARFMRTLKDGLVRFEKIIEETKKKKKEEVTGENVFLLKDTYGFPEDLTRVLAEEEGLSIDQAGYETCMEEQRERARGAQKFDASMASDDAWTILREADTTFLGYDQLEAGVKVTRFREVGDDILVCLDQTPFYAEAGGQVGDTGTIKGPDLELRVEDTFKILEMHVHRCSLIQGIVKDENFKDLKAEVDAAARSATMQNHSATHLLHSALRTILGEHVQQQGSRVAPEGLRFDFTHTKGMDPAQIEAVETIVNAEIMGNFPVETAVKPLEEAKAAGAMALFGENYADEVRTIKMGPTSHELCGGTHVRNTGDIGPFRIVSEGSIAAGIRRIEAVSGFGALELSRRESQVLDKVSKSLKVKPVDVATKVGEMSDRMKAMERELKVLRQDQVNARAQDMISSGEVIGSTRCVVQKLDAKVFPKATHQILLDSLAGKLGDGIAFLTCVEGDSLAMLAAVGPDARKKLKAGDLVKELSKHADGRGGGRPDRAQAGSKRPEKEGVVLAEAEKFLKDKLAQA